MGSLLWSAAIFIVTLGVLVSFHELGHFWVARRLGVKVLRFSIGFGKPLWKRRYGVDQVEYAVAAIPLGGYVKMLDEREAEVPEAEVHRAFNRQSIGKRMTIVVAGPLFNFILAIAAYWLMFVIGVPGIKPLVGTVEPTSLAASAGIRGGDEITAIDGTRTPTWEVVRLELLDAALDGKPVEIVVRGDSAARERSVQVDLQQVEGALKDGSLLEELGITPQRPQVPAVIGEVESGAPAAQAGLQAGDRIVAADNQPIADWSAWVEYVQAHPAETLVVEIRRDGVSRILQLTPERAAHAQGEIGRIGAAPLVSEEMQAAFRAEQQLGPIDAIGASLKKTWQMSQLTVRMLGRMVIGDVSLDNLSGPITIATYAGYTAAIGFGTFLSFLAIISISLGVLNLLPIPMLDGGHLMYYVVEWIKGKPISEATQIKMQQVGMVLLVMLVTLTLYNDIRRLFEN